MRRGGLKAFMKAAWQVVEPSNGLVWGWHLDAVCDHIEAVGKGQINRLLINVPPRTNKSLTASVFFPAYAWTMNPSMRMLFSSYSGALSIQDSVRCRRLLESPFYRNRWGDRFRLSTDQNMKSRFENDKTGARISTSVDGTVTGTGGDYLVCDDLLDPRRAESVILRKKASDFFWQTLPSRMNDIRTGRMVVIMQRLHTHDVAGEILEREGNKWVQLILPMEYDGPKVMIQNPLGFKDPRMTEGEILQEERFPKDKLADLKKSLGSYGYSGQYQQQPVMREGGLIKERWLSNRFECEDSLEAIMAREASMLVLSIDCASKPKERNDPSGLGVFGVFNDRAELYDVKKKRVLFPELVQWVKDECAKWKPHALLIEDKDAGQQLIQQLQADTKLPVIAINPGTLDKGTRMAAESPFIESGKLHLRDNADWLADYVPEMTSFTGSSNSGHDECVDFTSQFLKWLREKMSDGVEVVSPWHEEGVNRFADPTNHYLSS